MLTRRHLRIKVLQALYAYLQSDNHQIDIAEKQLVSSIEHIYDLAINQISFLLNLWKFAAERLEEGKLKFRPSEEDLNPNTRFIDNAFLKKLNSNNSLMKQIERLKISWTDYEEVTRRIYKSLRSSNAYREYLEKSPNSFREDKNFVLQIFNDFIVNDLGLQAIFEEKNLFWTNDIREETIVLKKEILSSENSEQLADREILSRIFRQEGKENEEIEVTSFEQSIYQANDYSIAVWIANRMMNDVKENWNEFSPLPPLLKTSDDSEDNDMEFLLSLFRKTILHFDEYNEYITEKIINWDLERIAVMDAILLKMAITEIIEFSYIPIKVTMNEYIELAKIYSTPKSSQFINGMLDKIVGSLKNKNLIKKAGRGLFE
ncbi:MAG TPA: transcription antitermination factor NusB [Bacteroidales bacterium]|jgi:N utilization substance protein B|nr:transcription antitermination factor NusB [Bacteroidales bacterium]